MNIYKISEQANQCRSKWGVSLTDPIDIIQIALHKIKNMTLIFLSMPMEVNGACFKYKDEKLIFINSKHSELRQRFTIAHEIYHLEFGDENFNFYGVNEDPEESKANAFAHYLLLPNVSLKKYEELDLESIIEIEQYYMIPHEEFIKRIGKNINLKKDIGLLGYNTQLHEPYTDGEVTMGHYVQLSDELYENELISEGLREEFLINAYCSNLVFGELDEKNKF